MTPQHYTLNAIQVKVLQWIADGCPENVMVGSAHRVSAAALRSRGLIRIKERGRTWRASITTAGTQHLKRLDGSPPKGTRHKSAVAKSRPGTRPAAPPRTKKMAHAKKAARREVTVPASLKGAHPFVLATRDAGAQRIPDSDGRLWIGPRAGLVYMTLSRRTLPRALRIAQAVLREATRRGWDVVPYPNHTYGARPGVAVKIRGHVYPVAIREVMEPIAFTAKEIDDWRDEGWPAYVREERADQMPPAMFRRRRATGRLRLVVAAGLYQGRVTWADGAQARVEDRLTAAFEALERRVQRAEATAAAHKRRSEEQRQARWESEAESRRIELEKARIKELVDEAQAWRRASDVRGYVAAVRGQVAGLDGEARERLEAWCAWAEEWARGSDPVKSRVLQATASSPVSAPGYAAEAPLSRSPEDAGDE